MWDHCEQTGVRHVHAHFGQVPATVAWFTAELGNRIGDDEWTWSVTIHGWHEFVNEREASLRQKVAAARFVVCISDYTRSQLMRISHPRDWTKLHVVRCGIDTAQLRPARPSGRSSPAAGADGRAPLAREGPPRDDRSGEAPGRPGPPVELDLIGPGEFGEELRELTASPPHRRPGALPRRVQPQRDQPAAALDGRVLPAELRRGPPGGVDGGHGRRRPGGHHVHQRHPRARHRQLDRA